MKTYRSFSSEETKQLGRDIARRLVARRSAPKIRRNAGALIFALKGDLGAGKTTFTQGFLEGLGSKSRATSPTFIIMRRHSLKKSKFKTLFHIDAYRLKSARHLEVLSFKAIAGDPQNIILIEWADRAKKIMPKGAQWVRFVHGKKENERKISIME